MNFNRTRKQPERMNMSEDKHLEHIGSRLLDEDPREGKSWRKNGQERTT